MFFHFHWNDFLLNHRNCKWRLSPVALERRSSRCQFVAEKEPSLNMNTMRYWTWGFLIGNRERIEQHWILVAILKGEINKENLYDPYRELPRGSTVTLMLAYYSILAHLHWLASVRLCLYWLSYCGRSQRGKAGQCYSKYCISLDTVLPSVCSICREVYESATLAVAALNARS